MLFDVVVPSIVLSQWQCSNSIQARIDSFARRRSVAILILWEIKFSIHTILASSMFPKDST